MTDEIVYCTSGCTNPPSNGTDDPTPRLAINGILCGQCLDQLHHLLDGAESVTNVTAWLADNIGQHLKSPNRNSTRGGNSASMDQTSDVLDALTNLHLLWVEAARNFAQDHRLSGPTSFTTAAITAWLRPWWNTLTHWAPIGDTITALRDAINDAHTVAPWRAHDRHRPGVPCPNCHTQTLLIPAGHLDVWCWTCGTITTRPDYLAHILEQARLAQARQRLEAANLDDDTLVTINHIAHILEVPPGTLRRWHKPDHLLEAQACQLHTRALQFRALDVALLTVRPRGNLKRPRFDAAPV